MDERLSVPVAACTDARTSLALGGAAGAGIGALLAISSSPAQATRASAENKIRKALRIVDTSIDIFIIVVGIRLILSKYNSRMSLSIGF